MLAVVGETVTNTPAGGAVGGGTGLTILVAVPQEASAMAARNTSRNKKRGRSAEDIVRIVSTAQEGWDNWTWGQKRGREGKGREVGAEGR